MRSVSKESFTVAIQETICFADLMLRWPYEAALKITREIYDETLNLYEAQHILTSDGQEHLRLKRVNPNNLGADYYYYYSRFVELVFLGSEVENIEKEKAYYKEIPVLKRSYGDFELCTHDNIERYAARLFHVLEILGPSYHGLLDDSPKKPFPSHKVSGMLDSKEAIAQENHEDPNKRRKIYIKKELWPSYVPQPKLLSQEIDFERIEQFIKEQRKQGINDQVELARLIDDFAYSNFNGAKLTHAQLGKLLPAKPGTNVEYNTHAKRGARLRKWYLAAS